MIDINKWIAHLKARYKQFKSIFYCNQFIRRLVFKLKVAYDWPLIATLSPDWSGAI